MVEVSNINNPWVFDKLPRSYEWEGILFTVGPAPTDEEDYRMGCVTFLESGKKYYQKFGIAVWDGMIYLDLCMSVRYATYVDPEQIAPLSEKDHQKVISITGKGVKAETGRELFDERFNSLLDSIKARSE